MVHLGCVKLDVLLLGRTELPFMDKILTFTFIFGHKNEKLKQLMCICLSVCLMASAAFVLDSHFATLVGLSVRFYCSVSE